MENSNKKKDNSITLGDLFEFAGCPLLLPIDKKSHSHDLKRKRKTEKPIVVKMAPGSDNWKFYYLLNSKTRSF